MFLKESQMSVTANYVLCNIIIIIKKEAVTVITIFFFYL